MMIKKILIIVFCTLSIAHAEVSILGDTSDQESDITYKFAKKQVEVINAVPRRKPQVEPLASARLLIDGENYTLFSFTFMAKKNPDEVCTESKKSNDRSYRCVEGQPDVDGCHLMFFDAQGKSVGFHTMKIKEKFPHFCNAMPALGVAKKANNELLVTMQYFIPEALQGLPVTPTGGGWFRMTSLFRVKAVNGKIEVEQDDACLGNPNRIDNIPEARKRLRQCSATK
jgi:hypothetical protein